MLSIIERVGARRSAKQGGYYYEDSRGRIKAALDSDGNDTDYDRWAAGGAGGGGLRLTAGSLEK